MFEHCDVNPYQTPQSCRVDEERRSKRTVFLRLFVGTLIGVSTHWVLLWTDTLSTEIPPAGGALLGFTAVLCYLNPVLLRSKILHGLGFFAGQISVTSCRPLFLINPFADVPRNIPVAWLSAMLAFLLSAAIIYQAVDLLSRTALAAVD
ncbi:hypothetical protein RBSWK_03103 [Rhodopirellula baltica SWK14]|uniref:Uncharacterized protein n=1 Tax=Rhodopirellula baltica SWK14 TaxID=993516 RepID=L7CG08_RHOBT|nr:hypothetical protein RBSWK_03103 [Rhodopirellula baltica SWK14]